MALWIPDNHGNRQCEYLTVTVRIMVPTMSTNASIMADPGTQRPAHE